MKALTIQNNLVRPLAEWLGKQALHGAESRQRSRFIKLLAERNDDGEKYRIELCKKHSEKDEKGEPIMLDEKGEVSTIEINGVKQGSFKIADIPGFQKDYK